MEEPKASKLLTVEKSKPVSWVNDWERFFTTITLAGPET